MLLVEDDIELREGLAENLRLNGLTVHEAATGSEFRTAIAMSEVDVAIIDINLPDASGFELAHDIGGQDDRPGIIILTARAGRQDRLRGYTEGADLYLTKPVDNGELVLAVRNLAKRVIQSRAHRPRPGPEGLTWRLDVARKLLISPDDKLLVLTGKEVMLLEMFEKAKEKPLSRSYLASVMGYGAPGPNHRGLDAALRRLKDKASKAQIDLPFLVVHTIGVRFVGNLKKIV
ncbi:response regulator transcription factor [Kaistia dalseonensis]|uniref:DNA-binding response OmpR family regulator n=1 Tax=Kaistia dalseonensis TaxID=410840 RepID=A0ABU0H8S5_9HYPH|nr:response regulator transcription factor [Kaistia dalseonensis]MCX5496085.1 response regulator transcription factor [Kaistia dalseonensis]MDQ0438690.1 DNA-binding response OmpR family regulator [Kaistia dalseonensis]